MNTGIKKHTLAEKWIYSLILLALCSGVILSIISWMNLCTEVCAAGHKYRLYGYSFEPLGIAFFSLTALLWGFTLRFPFLRLVVGALLSGAFGAELMFTYAQKYIIGHWCPVCLSIAFTVLLSFVLFVVMGIRAFILAIQRNQRGEIMKGIFKTLAITFMVITGFIIAEVGFAKFSKLQAIEKEFRTNIALGEADTNIDMYVFTDWKCPGCRKILPIIEKSASKITEKAKLLFIDVPVHDASLNFMPYNLSFLINNKKQYIQIRHDLEELAVGSEAPTQEEIDQIATKYGVKFKQLNYSDISAGTKYFQHVVTQFDIEKTPTVVIVNTKTKKGKKLVGPSEITEAGILKAIDAVK